MNRPRQRSQIHNHAASQTILDHRNQLLAEVAEMVKANAASAETIKRLVGQQLVLAEVESTLYSDSINDLPLLGAVRRAVAVNPDERLATEAAQRGWPVISLR